jgi:hypothetical protein
MFSLHATPHSCCAQLDVSFSILLLILLCPQTLLFYYYFPPQIFENCEISIGTRSLHTVLIQFYFFKAKRHDINGKYATEKNRDKTKEVKEIVESV